MSDTRTITNVTNSGWLISKTIEKNSKDKQVILKSKEIIQLSSLEDEEVEQGLTDGTWEFIDETKVKSSVVEKEEEDSTTEDTTKK